MALLRLFPFALVLLSITLSKSAPLPEYQISYEKRELGLLELSERSLNDLTYREIDDEYDLFARELLFEDEELSRRGLFDGIANAFKKVGEGVKKGAEAVKNVGQKAGEGVKKAAETTKNGVTDAAKKAAETAKKAADEAKKKAEEAKKVAQKATNTVKKVGEKTVQKVGNGAKDVVKKVGNGTKDAVKKVEDVAKKDGPKIGKFGLKTLSTGASVGSKFAKFVPGFGTAASLGLKGVSIGADIGSNAIKADVGKDLQKGIDIMDKVKNPIGGAAGAILNAFRRDLDEVELFERDLDENELLERDLHFDDQLWERSSDFSGEWDE